MKHLSSITSSILCCLALAWTASGQTPGTGHVSIKTVRSYTGQPPLTKPSSIAVYDFAATPQEVELNKAILQRVKTTVARSSDDEKTQIAHKVVDKFAAALAKDLESTGIPVKRMSAGEAPPESSLIVQGDFLLIDEGNRTRRLAIGLGSGASKVVANVDCYVSQPERNVILTAFQASSRSSLKPGAAETMGAGAAPDVAAAASGATEMKQNAEGDAGRMAKAIANHIKKTVDTQGWGS
jgi:phenylpyruvate tautomerase PptA (4-oxalocrotonate tautomerase family)